MQLVRTLAVSGARGPDDVPLASGSASFYLPGTLIPAVVWKDPDKNEAWPQPVPLDETGKAQVWIETQVRMIVLDADSVPILDADPANTDRDRQIEVVQPGWPNSPDLSAVLAALYASLGGNDGQYRADPAAIDRVVKVWLAELCVSVKDFGAKGDGLADDQPAVLSAYTYIAQHKVKGGRATLFFPAGVYRMGTDFPILDSGIRVLGSGRAATSLIFFAADSDGIILKSDDAHLADFAIEAEGQSQGVGFKIVDAARGVFDRLRVGGFGAGEFRVCCRIDGVDEAPEDLTFNDCFMRTFEDATARGVQVSVTEGPFAPRNVRFRGGNYDCQPAGVLGLTFDLQLAHNFELSHVKVGGGIRGIDAGYPDAPFLGNAVNGLAVHDCDFTGRTSGEDLKVSAQCDYVRTDRNLWKTGVSDEHDGGPSLTPDLGLNNIYTDVSRNPFGDRGPYLDLGLLTSGTDTPVPIDLDKGNYYRVRAEWGVGSTATVTFALPTSSWGIKAGQKLVIDACVIGSPNTVPPYGGYDLSGAWASAGGGQGPTLQTPVDGSFGYRDDNSVGAEALGGSIVNADEKFFNQTNLCHTIFTLVYNGTHWHATSRKTSKDTSP